ncbi:MAG: fumarylacetoacetate hydrolase family protein [Pyrinomonadaceae bacterium]
MKLYTFEVKGEARIGAEHDNRLLDLAAATRHDRKLPADMLALIKEGKDGLMAAHDAIRSAGRDTSGKFSYDFSEVKVLAPIPRPGKILCSGINYRAHKEENPQAVMPTEPFFFSKLPSAIIGPGKPIICPQVSRQVDYEVEFAVVIGRRMKNTPAKQVIDSLFGYTILHDVSARDVQFKDNQITLGKNFDSFCPLGPCLVTTDEMTNPGNVRLRTLLNGQVVQDGSTSDWVFSLPALLSFLSHRMTLEPGDIVSTGTPAGVGVFKKPQIFLKEGDIVRLEVEGIGALENTVIKED